MKYTETTRKRKKVSVESFGLCSSTGTTTSSTGTLNKKSGRMFQVKKDDPFSFEEPLSLQGYRISSSSSPSPEKPKPKTIKKLKHKKSALKIYTREESLAILRHCFAQVDAQESRMYKISAQHVAQASKLCTGVKFSAQHGEFRRTLTYGEVTPESVSDTILPLLELGPEDVFYDVGCGTGKIVIQAALETSCRATKGIELVIDRVEEGKLALDCLAKKMGKTKNSPRLCDRITIVEGDACDPPASANLNDATVIFINNVCFGPELMRQVMSTLVHRCPHLRRLVTLRKICTRHRARCSLQGLSCAGFHDPPAETSIHVTWAYATSAYLYLKK